MSNTFYSPGTARARRVNDLFGTIATRYDFLNDLQSLGLHRLWKRRLVDLAHLRPGDNALDLCCGTGDVIRLLVQTGATVVGLDFSAPMLNVATQRLRLAIPPDTTAGVGPLSVRFVCGDAMHTPFPDNSFDAITISYGLRNLASTLDGLREMFRLAKPGGRLLVLEFGKPRNRLWRSLYFAHLRWLVPTLGGWFSGNREAYAYIHESLLNYPSQDGIAALMKDVGAVSSRTYNFLAGAMSINYAEKPLSQENPTHVGGAYSNAEKQPEKALISAIKPPKPPAATSGP